jgi:hypothetical protein
MAAFFIATQQSSVPLSVGIVLLIGLAQASRMRRRLRPAVPMWSGLLIPPALAALLLCSANLVAHHRFALSPYGNVFLLARVIYDGPGRETLQRDCPTQTWRICVYRDRLPPNSDDFLWTVDSPLNLAGGPKQVAVEAGPIIRAALRTDPTGQLYASLANTWTQIWQFDSGDGLQPWPAQVSPWITQDFPSSEAAAYQAARQQTGHLGVPRWMATVHRAVALGGTIICLWLLAAGRPSRPISGFLLTILVTLPLSAAITGALSAPHDRYQARIMWLPPFIAAVAAARPRFR